VKEARATKTIQIAKKVRVVRLNMIMQMKCLETMLSVLVNQAEKDTPK